MKSSRKAEIESRVFVFLLVAMVIILLLVFASCSIKKARDKAREIEQKRLEQEISASVQELEYGSVDRKQLRVPTGTKEVCFIDITKRSKVLSSPIIKADKYNRMRSIIESGEKKNIFFLIQQDPHIIAIYEPGICFDHYPYFVCFEPRADILNLYLEGKGSCALIVMEYKVCEKMIYEEGRTEEQGTISQKISFGSIYAKLTISQGTVFKPAPDEVCIEAVIYLGAQGLISEVYNITPVHITATPGVKFDLKYEPFLLPPDADAGHVKLMQSSSPWNRFASYSVDWDNSRVAGDTTGMSYIAVFGPQPPTAVIKVNGDIVNESTEVIVIKDTPIKFNGSNSTDPDDDIDSYEWDFGDGKPKKTGEEVLYSYDEPGSYNTTLTVTDKTGYNGKSTILVTVVNDGNEKGDMGDIIITSNPTWQKILPLVPVAMWTDINGTHRVPYLVYHKKENEPEIYTSHFRITGSEGVKNTYYPNRSESSVNVDLFTNETAITNVQGVNLKSLETDYFSNWLSYEDVVAVGYNNEDAALMASLFAASINAPLIIIDGNHLPASSAISGKTVYVIDYDKLDQASENYVNQADKVKKYSLANLKNPNENPRIHERYLRLKSKIALISDTTY